MAAIYEHIGQLIGNTPLIRLSRYGEKHGLAATILAKLESCNPAGSVKDRIGLAMIEDAQKKGLLRPGSVIIEPTSGNTGIALALMAAVYGYRLILTMPETMSVERRNLLKAYGAEVVLTEAAGGMKGAITKAEQLTKEIPGSFMPQQFTNEVNPMAHRLTTGPEIWRDTDGRIDIFVAGVGTGGTISGAGGYLKSKNPALHIVAVEPAGSPVLSQGISGPHKIQGIGAGFVPQILDTSIYDEIVTIKDDEAFATGRELGHIEGILVGISSGAALAAATKVASQGIHEGKTIVVILPDSGDRYFSTPLFTE